MNEYKSVMTFLAYTQLAVLVYQLVDVLSLPNPMKLVQVILSVFFTYGFFLNGSYSLEKKE